MSRLAGCRGRAQGLSARQYGSKVDQGCQLDTISIVRKDVCQLVCQFALRTRITAHDILRRCDEICHFSQSSTGASFAADAHSVVTILPTELLRGF